MKVYEVLLKCYSFEFGGFGHFLSHFFKFSYNKPENKNEMLHLLIPDVISRHDGMKDLRWAQESWTANYWLQLKEFLWMSVF